MVVAYVSLPSPGSLYHDAARLSCCIDPGLLAMIWTGHLKQEKISKEELGKIFEICPVIVRET